MARHALIAALATAFSATVLAANGAATCGPGNQCPEATPCCSQYGVCGVGAYCLGGCDPLFSHKLDSCVPNPVCKSGDYKLKDLSDIQSIDKYLGDPSKANWVSQGKPIQYNDAILLTMAEGTVGTLLESTHYVWYGKICASMTSSQGKGVVTAFIMMSNVKDEIDFEWVGVDTSNVQSNWYSQGVTNYNNGKNLTVGNTVEQPHEYCIDWTPDELSWLIDGKSMRTVKRTDTWNSTSNRFDYPQTPSRIMISLWPAGLPSNAKGTIEWAGGEIDWNSQYMTNGYYYAMVSDVSVECYDPPANAKKSGDKAYIYTDKAGTNDTIEIVNDLVILKSLYATGEKPNEDPFAVNSASSSGSAKAKPTPTNVETIPGGISGGGRTENENEAQSSGSSNGPSASGTGAGAQPSQTSSGSFQQGNGNNGNNGGSTGGAAGKEGALRMGGSALAVCVAVLGLVVL